LWRLFRGRNSRHTMATLMHENGADIRFIKEILGHVKLETTQIYTHVAIRTLQQFHAATHPAALLGHRPDESRAAARLRSRSQGTVRGSRRRGRRGRTEMRFFL